ncbi:hypothetical protein, partial [Micromonospora sp. NPDC005979]|uniref:hypothetical protein n=1 Tax=Micromonospora sp. NPDC005979 TaxID=3156726 RepID=UPI0033B6F171
MLALALALALTLGDLAVSVVDMSPCSPYGATESARRFYVCGDRFGWLPLGSASMIAWVTHCRSGR